METITKIGNCLTTPYVIIVAIIVTLSLLKRIKINRVIIFIFVFSLTWRFFFKISSSRYCCNFLILFFICFGITLQKIVKDKYSSLATRLILCILLPYNIIDSLYSSQNTFILDCNEYLRSNLIEKDSVFLIDSREYSRIQENIKNMQKRFDLSSHTVFESIIGKYSFWKCDGYYVIYEKKGSRSLIDSRQKKVCSFVSKKKYLNIYRIKKFSPLTSIANDKIESLIQEDIKNGNLVSDLIKTITRDGILKSFNTKKNIYIYQYENKIYWFVDKNLPNDSEIICHIYSEKPDLLPPERIQYGYDNLGFILKKQKAIYSYNGYNIYSKKISNEYPIACIKVGTEYCGVVTWFYPFKP